MGEEEARAFVAQGGQPCVRYSFDADGRVMFNSRNESPNYRRLITYSEDGATNWSTPGTCPADRIEDTRAMFGKVATAFHW